jgi:cell division control protein 6
MNTAGVLDKVFDKFISNAKIFKDREVLRHDYLPERLPHRENQIRELGEVVAPVLKGARSSNILIYGKTGTGKTAVAKHVLNHLSSKTKKFNDPVVFCYVNCRMANSAYRVFSRLCQSIDISIPFTGLSGGEVFDRLRAGLNRTRVILMIVLDEADELIKTRGGGLLYELTRINETLDNSKVTLVCISNDLRFKEFLDPRVLSSLSEEEIVFKPYDADELRSILLERVKAAFFDGTLTDAALGLCAALAASEHGDARRALDLLRVAGEVAERKCAVTVNEEHVREAERHIEHNRVVEGLQNLTFHSKLVVLSVYHLNRANFHSAITGEIYEVYGELSRELGVSPLTQRRLGSLVNELDAIGLLNARVISMGRYGRTKKIQLSIASHLVKDVFVMDSRLQYVVDFRPKCLLKSVKNRIQ